MPVEEIARLVGHAGGSRVTEAIYRKEIRPVLMTGAEVMDQALRPRRRVIRGKPRALGPEQDDSPGRLKALISGT